MLSSRYLNLHLNAGDVKQIHNYLLLVVMYATRHADVYCITFIIHEHLT